MGVRAQTVLPSALSDVVWASARVGTNGSYPQILGFIVVFAWKVLFS